MKKKVTEESTLSKTQEKSDSDFESLRKEFHKYKMEKEAEIDRLKSGKPAGGAAPPPAPMPGAAPPPGAGAAPPPAAGVPGAAAPPPAAGIPGAAAPPPLAGAGSAAAPPPLKGAAGPPKLAAAEQPYLPAKSNIAPQTKMKNFHWAILTVNKIKDTV